MPWTLCALFQFPPRLSLRRRRTNPVTKERDASGPESDLLHSAQLTEQTLHEDTYIPETPHTGVINIPFGSVLSSVIDPLLDIINHIEFLTRLYRYHKRDTFLFVVLGSYRTSTGVTETLTHTRPWWHHVISQTVSSSGTRARRTKPRRTTRALSSKDLSVHDTSQADYPRAMTTVDDSCDGGQAANEPEARERSRSRGQPLSRHVVSRPAREQGPEGTLNRAAKRRWRGGAARDETKGEPRHRAAGRHTRQRTMHDGRERNAHSGTPDTTPNERDADARPTTADAAVGH
ncbi:hypothetical protein B0H14DRAFT_3632327 [Mycena olivaceomarginata]|nr:hypothetical protein B0H14DRAFT_3632327 [Mycena olivaceomarginata]